MCSNFVTEAAVSVWHLIVTIYTTVCSYMHVGLNCDHSCVIRYKKVTDHALTTSLCIVCVILSFFYIYFCCSDSSHTVSAINSNIHLY